MKKKDMFLLLSFLVFLPVMPYLFHAWRNSRLDSLDWIFYLLAIPALIWAWKDNESKTGEFKALFVALPMLFLAWGGNWHNVNALSVFGAAGFVWTMTWLTGGWNFAYRLLPGFFIMVLGTPSSSYRLAQLLTVSFFWTMGIKFCLAALCFLWIYANKRFAKVLKAETMIFLGALAASGIVLLHANELYFSGQSFIPAFKTQIGGFYGRSILPDNNTKRFFATSTVRQYRYWGADNEISVLAVKCGKDVHEIHPASHCLRTSSWTVTAEKMLFLKDNFAVTEIKAHKGKTRALIWVWYSSDEFSTSGFLGFRRRFRPDGKYHTFQIFTPVEATTEKSRKRLNDFLTALVAEK